MNCIDVYEGDEGKVTYKIGELFEYIINGMDSLSWNFSTLSWFQLQSLA